MGSRVSRQTFAEYVPRPMHQILRSRCHRVSRAPTPPPYVSDNQITGLKKI